MAEITIRPAVSPDIEYISRFDHSSRTLNVWQMYQDVNNGKISTIFVETSLPREMKINYPKSPDMLINRWKEFSVILISCMDNAPIGYISLSTSITEEMVWIKDLVVEQYWRRRGIGTLLVQAAIDWAKDRDYLRLSIEMSSKNFPAISLAEKLGFEFTGFNDNYFRNRDLALFFARIIK